MVDIVKLPAEEPGTLKLGEPHPMAQFAKEYVLAFVLDPKRLGMIKEALSSCALAGNRGAEILSCTLDRILACKPVSDRYLLGLAWGLKLIEEEDN